MDDNHTADRKSDFNQSVNQHEQSNNPHNVHQIKNSVSEDNCSVCKLKYSKRHRRHIQGVT